MLHNLRSVALVVVALLVMGVPVLWVGPQAPETYEVAAAESSPPVTSGSTLPDPTPQVASDAYFLMEELDLLEDIQSVLDTTTTTVPETTTTEEPDPSTSTTAPSATTSTAAAPTTTAPSAPSTTKPPATTSSSTTTTTAPVGGYSSSAESDFASKINSHRSSNGHSSLSRAGSLDSYARSWAKQMADNGQISHSNVGSLIPPWSSVGENVGTGGSVSDIFDALRSSSGHNSNMLGDFTHMGIGVYKDGSGQLWTAHVFAR
jgi:uncharacterized protein YkwD